MNTDATFQPQMPSHHIEMPIQSPTRLALLLALSPAMALTSQVQLPPRSASSLPATPATSLPVAAPQVGAMTATPAIPDAAARAHRAEVAYASGMMTVNANNSSLNSILREIARQTGMKITGGVREERVFGHYGPATPSDILATLLGGTGTNMVLRQTAAAEPSELILTPRNGGVTPPNPNAPGFADDPAEEPLLPTAQQPQQQQQPSFPFQGPAQGPPPQQGSSTLNGTPSSANPPANNVLGDPRNVTPTASQIPTTNSVPVDTLPTPSTTTETIPGIVDTPNPAPADTSNPVATTATSPSSTDSTSTDGVKTPEQIFQELQKLRQQQQQPH